MSVCVYSVFVLSSGLVTHWFPVQGDLPTVIGLETEAKRSVSRISYVPSRSNMNIRRRRGFNLIKIRSADLHFLNTERQADRYSETYTRIELSWISVANALKATFSFLYSCQKSHRLLQICWLPCGLKLQYVSHITFKHDCDCVIIIRWWCQYFLHH
jgi:hypothetical protein